MAGGTELKNVCFTCGLETDEPNGPCVKCGGPRIVDIETVVELWGPDWRSAFETTPDTVPEVEAHAREETDV